MNCNTNSFKALLFSAVNPHLHYLRHCQRRLLPLILLAASLAASSASTPPLERAPAQQHNEVVVHSSRASVHKGNHDRSRWVIEAQLTVPRSWMQRRTQHDGPYTMQLHTLVLRLLQAQLSQCCCSKDSREVSTKQCYAKLTIPTCVLPNKFLKYLFFTINVAPLNVL